MRADNNQGTKYSYVLTEGRTHVEHLLGVRTLDYAGAANRWLCRRICTRTPRSRKLRERQRRSCDRRSPPNRQNSMTCPNQSLSVQLFGPISLTRSWYM